MLRRALRSTLFRDFAVTYSGQLIGSGIGFAIQLLLQRTLGADEYGIFGLATSGGVITAVLTDLGVSHAMIRFASKYLERDRRRANATFAVGFYARMVLTSVVALAGFLMARTLAVDVYHKPALEGPLTWVYLGLAGGSLWSYWQYYVQTHQQFKLRSAVVIFVALVRLGLFSSLWATKLLSPTTMVMVDAGTNVIGFAVGMFFAPRGLFDYSRADLRAAFDELLPYCRYTAVFLAGEAIFNELDTTMLGIFKPAETVGLYRAAWTYAMVLGFLNMSVSNVVFPKVAAITDVGELRLWMKRMLKLTVPLAVCTLPALPIVAWWIPFYERTYAGATVIFDVMYVGLVFDLIVGPLGFVLFCMDRPGVLAAAALVKIGLNIAGNWALIPAYGALGAAWATVATRAIGAGLWLWVIWRNVR